MVGMTVLYVPSLLGSINLKSWRVRCMTISQEVFIRFFHKSQFPYRSANVFFTLVMIKDKLSDSSGNGLLQNDT